MKLTIKQKPEATITINVNKFKTRLKETLDYYYALDKSITNVETEKDNSPDAIIQYAKLFMPWEMITHRLEDLEKDEIKITLHKLKCEKLNTYTPLAITPTNEMKFEFKENTSNNNELILIIDILPMDCCIHNFISKTCYTWFSGDEQIKWKLKVEIK